MLKKTQKTMYLSVVMVIILTLFANLNMLFASSDSKDSMEQEVHAYLDYPSIQMHLKSWADKAPEISEYCKYGTDNGYDTTYLRISKAVGNPTTKLPPVLLYAAIHGNEAISATVTLGMAYRLITLYGIDPKVSELVNTRDIYIVPVASPGGYIKESRLGSEGKDPNRSFPYPGQENTDLIQSVQALKDLFERVGFKATADYHSYGRQVMFPRGYTWDALPKETLDKYSLLCKDMTDSIKKPNYWNYVYGSLTRITKKTVSGNGMDYFFIKGQEMNIGTCAITMEVGTADRPERGELIEEIDNHFTMLKIFLERAPTLFSE